MAGEQDDLIFRAALRDEVTAPLERLRRELIRTKAAGESAGKGLSSVGKASTSASRGTRLLHEGLARISSALSKISRGFGGFVSGVGESFVKWTKRAAVGFGLLAGYTVKLGFNLAANNELFYTATKRMLGSDAAALKLSRSLAKFAEKTPFNLEGLRPLTQQLLGVGFTARSIIPTLTGLGDAVAAVGGGNDALQRVVRNLGQIQSKRKLSMRDLTDFADANIPAIAQLSAALKMTPAAFMAKLGTGGGGADLFKQLGGGEGVAKALGGGKLAGALEAASGTTKGILSNIVDSFQRGLSLAIGGETGTSGAAGGLKGFLARFQARLGPAMERFGTFFNRGFTRIMQGNLHAGSSLFANAFGLGPGAAGVFETILRSLRAIGSIIGSVGHGIADAFGKIFTSGERAGRKAKGLSDWLEGIVRHGPAIRSWTAKIVVWLANAVKLVWRVGKAIADFLVTWTPRVVAFIAGVVDKVRAFLQWASEKWNEYGPIVTGILSGIGAAFTFVGWIVDGLITKIGDLIDKIKEIPQKGLMQIVRGAASVVPGANSYLTAHSVKANPRDTAVNAAGRYAAQSARFGNAIAAASTAAFSLPVLAGSTATATYSLNAPININGVGGDSKDIAKQVAAELDKLMKKLDTLSRER